MMIRKGNLAELILPAPRQPEARNFRQPHIDHFYDEVWQRLLDSRNEWPDGWLFVTPLIHIRCAYQSLHFLRFCRNEERRWCRHARKLFGGRMLKSARQWCVYVPDRQLTHRSNRYLQFVEWSYHCRGNMLPAGEFDPDDRWRDRLVQMERQPTIPVPDSVG